ncbi:hypothetical protein MY494_11680 [Synechococcus sp. A10-1-5-1]|uniref:hypothetical protein n=1 Tax=Synechococcus sp. A10-1-5-1 TaxID=2936507 RepID=UPI0020013952|nr:hypothetical protein [Synechococcus sp. A10-1-5-1]UPM49958.1 hypothetical protein MY494_11680 [Synechococcus sp. A10-1-5-1]
MGSGLVLSQVRRDQIWRVLNTAERNGQRCGGPVLLSGMVVGAGLVELSAGPLGQSSRFSLELLTMLVLQLVGPLVVSLLGMALMMPNWLDRVERRGSRAWLVSVPASALLAAVLLLLFLISSFCAGALTTPRNDLIGEARALLSGVAFKDVLRAMLRCSFFLACICAWSQWRGYQELKRDRHPALMVSNLLMEGLMVLFALKLLWISILDPINLQAASL